MIFRPNAGIASDSARAVADAFVAVLQDAIDRGSADAFNARFAADVLWGSPFGAVVDGYETTHAIHARMFGAVTAVAGASLYSVEHARAISDDVVLAYVRRVRAEAAVASEEPGKASGFDELALFVLKKHDGAWWLAAGQHVPDRRDVYASAR